MGFQKKNFQRRRQSNQQVEDDRKDYAVGKNRDWESGMAQSLVWVSTALG
jgi:hypothetical protein